MHLHASFESETFFVENVSVYHSNVHFLVIVDVANIPITVKYNIIMVNKRVMVNIIVISFLFLLRPVTSSSPPLTY